MIKDHRVYRPYKRKNSKRFIFFLIKILIITFIFYQVISHFLLTSFVINSSSMKPTIAPGEHLFLSPLSYGAPVPFSKEKMKGLQIPARGDIVVIRLPNSREKKFPLSLFDTILSFLSLNKKNAPQSTFSVKRIIALPGDTVKIEGFKAYIKAPDSQTFVAEQDLILSEYKLEFHKDQMPVTWKQEFPFSGNLSGIKLAENEYFVLGDNRLFSNDSRSWQEPIAYSHIIGKVWWRYFPFKKIGFPR